MAPTWARIRRRVWLCCCNLCRTQPRDAIESGGFATELQAHFERNRPESRSRLSPGGRPISLRLPLW